MNISVYLYLIFNPFLRNPENDKNKLKNGIVLAERGRQYSLDPDSNFIGSAFVGLMLPPLLWNRYWTQPALRSTICSVTTYVMRFPFICENANRHTTY